MHVVIDLGYTDDGCYEYLHTCCGMRQETRSGYGRFCQECGDPVGALRETERNPRRGRPGATRREYIVTVTEWTDYKGDEWRTGASEFTCVSRALAVALARAVRDGSVLPDYSYISDANDLDWAIENGRPMDADTDDETNAFCVRITWRDIWVRQSGAGE